MVQKFYETKTSTIEINNILEMEIRGRKMNINLQAI